MTTATTRNSRFQRGSGVYVCRTCGHNTRDTGGDGAGVQLCDLCFDLAGEENHISDNSGGTYESAENVRSQLAALDKRNGPGTARRVFPEVCDAVAYV
jgi:hypothetical protein